MRKIEGLHRGLWTSTDPAVSPEGALQLAQNARYRPGDLAIWQSEGRQKVGDGSHGSVPALTGIQWDPGSTVDGIQAELSQILYVNANVLKTIPALSSASDPGMNSKRTVSVPSGVIPDLLSGHLATVQYANEHFVLTGGDNLKLIRNATGQVGRRHGMKVNEQKFFSLGTSPLGGSTLDITPGWYYFWWNWYDSVDDVEGTSTVDASSAFTTATSQTDINIRLNITASDFTTTRPANADSIRLYTSGPWDVALATYTNPPGITNPWPIGYRLATIPINTLIADGSVTIGLTTYYAIAITTTAIAARYDVIVTQTEWDNLALVFPPMDIVTIAVDSEGAATGKNGPPPKATTGDSFEESLCLNDVEDKRKVRFSFPGDPDAFPAVYFINFETAELDEVVAIRTLGNKLGVFLTNSIHRVNWLPAQSDFDFGRGRVKDEVVAGKGTFWHKSVTKFDMPGKGPLLAYVARTGVYATDLFSEIKLTRRLDWPGITRGLSLSRAILLNDPDEERLILGIGSVWYYLHYDPDHLDEDGIPAITGPIQRPRGIQAADLVRLADGARIVVSSEGSGLFYEGRGFSDAAAPESTLLWDVKTRDIYPAGVGEEATMSTFLGHLKPSLLSAGSWNLKVNAFLATQSSPVVKIADTISIAERQLKITSARALFEFYNVEMSGVTEGAGMAVNFVGVEYEPLSGADAH